MSKADDMFKELGYKKDEKPLEFVNETIPYINYRDNNNYKTIHFNLDKKFITMSCINKDFTEVLQAINEKCKELEWLDE